MSDDLKYVRKLIETRDTEALLRSGIKAEHLFDEGKAAFEYVLGFFQTHGGRFPELSTVEDDLDERGVEFTFDVIQAPEPLTYYVEKLRTRAIGNIISQAERGLIDKLKDKQPWEALAIMRETVGLCDREFVRASDEIISVTETVERRIDDIMLRSEWPVDVDGVPSGWLWLDQTTMGWHKGEFIVLAAILGTGKTWALTLLGERALLDAKRVLFVQPEMRTTQIATRFDALYAGVSHSDLKRGRLGDFVLEEFVRRLRRLYDLPGKFWVAGNASMRTVDDIRRVAREFHPDLILVDSFYKMVSAKRRSVHEEIKDASWELRLLAQELDIPIIGSAQFNKDVREPHRRRRASSAVGEVQDIGGSYGIPQDADVVITLYQDRHLRERKVMAVIVHKVRDDQRPALCLYVNWDHTTGNFSQIGPGEIPTVSEEDDAAGDSLVAY